MWDSEKRLNLVIAIFLVLSICSHHVVSTVTGVTIMTSCIVSLNCYSTSSVQEMELVTFIGSSGYASSLPLSLMATKWPVVDKNARHAVERNSCNQLLEVSGGKTNCLVDSFVIRHSISLWFGWLLDFFTADYEMETYLSLMNYFSNLSKLHISYFVIFLY